MGKKVSALLAGLTSFTFSAAAQPAVSNRTLEYLVTFLNGFAQNYIGVPITETNMLPTLMIIGAYYLAFYFALEAFLDKVGWLSRLQTGRRGDKSNRRLIGLSLLLFIGFMGSPLFTPLLLIARDSIFLMMAVVSIVALIGVLQGSFFFSSGAGKAAKAGGKEYLNDAKNRLQEAEELTSQAEQEEQDSEARREGGDGSAGDQEARDAASKMEQAIQDIEQVIEDIEAIEGKDESDIRDILQKARNAKMGGGLGAEKNFESRLQAVDQALQVMEGLSRAGRSAGDIESQIASGTSFADFGDLESHIQALYSDLQTYANREGVEEGTVEDELEELIDIVEDFRKTHELLENLSAEMQAARDAENFEEELARQYGDEDLYEQVEVEENQVRKLGEKIDELEQFHQNLESEIEEAIEIVNEHINLDESELNELENARENLLPDIESRLESTEQALSSNAAFDPTTGGKDEQLVEILNSIDVDSLNDLMVQIEERMRGAENSWRNRMNKLINNFPP
ncbi:MAG: hypothetical protein ABEJ91_02705 [Candidatus Nanohaloarchaea archaeon]